MPLQIVRNNIVSMAVDVIVNTANPNPIIGSGCDHAIHQAAGPQLLKARKAIGSLAIAQPVITPGFDLPAKYVIHVAGPVWRDGAHNEEQQLRNCYTNALELAKANHCRSIAFPLMAAGSYGFPNDLALQTALSAFSAFLMKNEMDITLVVFNKDTYALSRNLFRSVESYVDEHYVEAALDKEYSENSRYTRRRKLVSEYEKDIAPSKSLDSMLAGSAETFSQMLMRFIMEKDLKESEVYHAANLDRKLFSKIRNKVDYQPRKNTALALAIGLRLSPAEARQFLASAGYAFSSNSKTDIIVMYFLEQGSYDMFTIEATLFERDLPTLGAK